MRLPIADDSLDAIAISFGFRNLANYNTALIELQRVLKPGGALAILEFSHPAGRLMKLTYGLYSKLFMPVVGAAISGSREAYAYLPESIRRFPAAPSLRQMMLDAGFEQPTLRTIDRRHCRAAHRTEVCGPYWQLSAG